MTVNEFLRKYRKPLDAESHLLYARPRAKCADGFTVSIQAGYGLYSTPRADAEEYTKVELAYPSHADPSFLPYADNEESPIDSIYAFVPVRLVDAVMQMHGGIVGADFSNDGGNVWHCAEQKE